MILSFLKNLLFPLECLGCRHEGEWLCQKCFRRLQFGCPEAARKNLAAPALDKIFIAGNYEDKLLAELIKKFKYNFISQLGAPLGKFLAMYWAGQLALEPGLGVASLIPVPLSRRRERWRGFNQAEILTRELAAEFSYDLKGGLIRSRHRPPQSSLAESERRKNLAGAFTWAGEKLDGQSLILIDDVITTGTTLNEAASVLKRAGAERVYGLVLAKG